MSLKVGILMGGPSEERNVSLSSGEAVADACKSLGYKTTEFIFENNYQKLIHNLKNQDIIFNSLHGGIGENGKIQAWMDQNEIKYTGSGSAASALCMDKARSKDLASIHGVETAEWESLYTVKDKPTVGLPFVVKPNEQGSTIGLNIVNNESEIETAIQEAFKHGSQIMVEKYIEGRELTVTVLGCEAYPIVEIEPSHKVYDYTCKYTPGMSKYICPAELDDGLTISIKKDTELLFSLLGCKVYARADYLLDNSGNHYFLEMNTLPGMTSTSLVPKSVQAEGVSFQVLIKNIIELSL